MKSLSRKRILLILILSVFSSVPLYAQKTIPPILKNLHGRVEAGWLADSDIYRYLVDVNLWFDFGQYKDFIFFFDGGILTYISDTEEDSFQPERFRGTLQPGTYLQKGRNTYYFYIKHQSFHDIDMYDELDESYEIYTLAYKFRGTPNFFLSVGKFLNTADVEYDWEYLAWLEYSCIGRCMNRPIYLLGSARKVTEDDNPTGRDGFTDYTAELGIQTSPNLRYFTAYKVIHDINQFNGITDHQIELGLKYLW